MNLKIFSQKCHKTIGCLWQSTVIEIINFLKTIFENCRKTFKKIRNRKPLSYANNFKNQQFYAVKIR